MNVENGTKRNLSTLNGSSQLFLFYSQQTLLNSQLSYANFIEFHQSHESRRKYPVMNRCLFPVIIRDFGYANSVLAAYHIPAGFRIGKIAIVSPQFIGIHYMCHPGCLEKEMHVHPVMLINIVQADRFVQ